MDLKNILLIVFLSGMYLRGSDDALREIVEINNNKLTELKTNEKELIEINKKLEEGGLDPEDLIDLQSKKEKLEQAVSLASDLKNPFGDLIEKIEAKNGLINTLIEKEFFKIIKDAGFIINEDQVVRYIKSGHKKPMVSFGKSIQLEKMIPLIPSSVTCKPKTYNKLWSYCFFSSYYFGLIATTKELRNKVYVLIKDVSKADEGVDKLKVLVLIFAKAQIIEYKQLAAKELKDSGFSDAENKNFFVQRYATDFVSSSSPALIAARVLYEIKPILFDSKRVYLKKIENVIKSNFKTADTNSAYFYDEFIRAVKENKAQYAWRNYSGYVFGGGSIIGLLLILAKKYQWNAKFQEFLEKYRNK